MVGLGWAYPSGRVARSKSWSRPSCDDRAVELPDVGDPAAVVDYVRRRGSILVAQPSIGGDFLDWRRRVRRAARDVGIRISVRRDDDTVLVYHPDHEVTDAEKRAVMDAIASVMSTDDSAPTVTYDEALQRRRRENLRLVRDDDEPRH